MPTPAPLPLPPPAELRALLRLLALVNAIAVDDPARWRHRFTPMAASWLEVATVTAVDAALTVVFAASGTVGTGYDRRSRPGDPPAAADVPSMVSELLATAGAELPAPGFSMWWSAASRSWNAAFRGPGGRHEVDGLLALLFTDPGELADWVAHTHHVRMAPSRLAALLHGGRLSEELVRGLNPACSYRRLFRDHRHLHPLWEPPAR